MLVKQVRKGRVTIEEAAEDAGMTVEEFKKILENTPKNISAATVARTAVLGLALTNQLLSAAGKPVLPIESTQVEQLVSAGFTIGAALASWWYNNSFTQAAIKADEEFERQKKRV